ncbi:MAG: two-component system sensor histidine kinase NtrB [Desulfovibrio sp.]|uniref:two-component system sensor histidine kinase NtrB n=1 Tax=Desulfovibrio sp. 7SRBS1 TaxID=3378064 RepID=UPI003B3C0B6A
MELLTTLEDLVGIEHSKLNFFQELQQSIKQLRATNRESENQRREIAAILDGITDVMMVLSEDLRIISVNRVFEDIFPGINPIGKTCYSIFRHTGKPCPECPAFRSLNTNSVCRETAIFRISGRNRQFDMVASPLKNPEWKEHRVLIFKRDVTLEKEYQAKFYQAEKMATIGVLAAGVAHEINNPLAAVSGFAEGIQRRLAKLPDTISTELSDDLIEYTDTILKECNRCQEIVQTLLTFSRPISAEFTHVGLNNVVRDTLKLLHHQLRKRNAVNLKVGLDPELPLIQGDEAQLKQVTLNLLTNALDAVGEEGTISVRTACRKDGYVGLSVCDTGCGIPQENLDMLFEPFFTTKPVGKGIGIGLSTCFNIVRDHGGEIFVQHSEPGEGSNFTVKLPIQTEDERA